MKASPTSNRETGFVNELKACQYLNKLGFKIIKRNLYIQGGEIDVMAVSPTKRPYFIEVKSARSSYKVDAVENFTKRKQRLFLRAAKKIAHRLGLNDYGVGLVVINPNRTVFYDNDVESD